MEILSYSEIKKQHQDRVNKILDEHGVFWAFSNEQFEKNKTPLKEGEKYTSLGSGGFIPKSNLKSYIAAMEEATKQEKETIKANKKTIEDAIRYELANHECWYTGDITDVIPIFKGIATKKQILSIYHKGQKA